MPTVVAPTKNLLKVSGNKSKLGFDSLMIIIIIEHTYTRTQEGQIKVRESREKKYIQFIE
tara:strand:+ start:392 stop:571 length:180 start_codon:yes stop_codon:yes gene_type:complete